MRRTKRTSLEKVKEFTLLEKDIFIIHSDGKYQVIMPGIQSCAGFVLWHKDLCIAFHANGYGNEMAAVDFVLDEFKRQRIPADEIQLEVISSDHNHTRSNFIYEALSYHVGFNNDAIVHPIMERFRKAGIDMPKQYGLTKRAKEHATELEKPHDISISFDNKSNFSMDWQFFTCESNTSSCVCARKKSLSLIQEELKNRPMPDKQYIEESKGTTGYRCYEIKGGELSFNGYTPIDSRCREITSKVFGFAI